MPIKKMLLVAACLILSACAEPQSGASYMGGREHPLADNSSVYAVNRGHQDRENCQMYERDTSKMAYIPPCMRSPLPAPAPMEATVVREVPAVAYTEPTPVLAPDRLLPISRSYPVYFDFDKSGIRDSETATLNQITHDMGLYHPPQVTVTGHTDRSGSAKYNEGLSERRAASVSGALTERGISNQIINEQARGETQPAVDTADGVKLPANRRAMVDFRGEERVKSSGQ